MVQYHHGTPICARDLLQFTNHVAVLSK